MRELTGTDRRDGRGKGELELAVQSSITQILPSASSLRLQRNELSMALSGMRSSFPREYANRFEGMRRGERREDEELKDQRQARREDTHTVEE